MERVRIRTNDPDRPWIEVAVTGKVERFAEIRPERVRLAGPAGARLVAEVEIIPRAEYPFTIRQIRARLGDHIQFERTGHCSDTNGRCSIRIENTRQDPGRYVDTLYLHTDSPLRPTIPIVVTGIIQ